MAICSKCGEDNPDRARFCLNCANSLPAPESQERELRKTVTAVFCDMTGSTEMGERLDPESVRRVMSRFYEEMRTALEQHGGTVEKFIGDAVVGVFGVPSVHEDDGLRAVRAAEDMRTRLRRLNDELESRWGIRIGTRTGINTGEVVAGDPEKGESFVVGDAINTAARLEQAAPSGEILLGPDTYRLVRAEVEVQPVEPLQLKGKAEPVPAYRLVALREGAAQQERLGSSLVGREGELKRLTDALDEAAAEERCRLITVVGSAGVGKSRLGFEFVRQVKGSRCRVVSGRCVSYGEGITYWPVVEILRQGGGIAESETPQEAREKLLRALPEGEDREAVTDRLAGLLGAGDAPPHQEEIFWAVRRFLEAQASVQPLVVILEDLHWAEPSLLDLLEHLQDRSRGFPILIVAFARPELRELRARFVSNGSSVLLGPLDADATRALVENHLGRDKLPEEILSQISEASEGNPLFVGEMLQMLIDDGYLRRDRERWSLAKPLSRADIPPSVEALLGARLGRLREEEREVAQRASVAGKVFSRGALAELSPETIRPQLGIYLDALVQKELFEPDDAVLEDGAFRFHHILIRDAAYRSMLKERRAELHERFADWLRSRSDETETEREDLVGYHLEHAYRLWADLGPLDERGREIGRRASGQLAGSARRAAARGDMPAAVNLAERALDLSPEGDPARSDLTLLLSSALLEIGEAERATEAVEQAAHEAAGDELRKAHVAVQRAYLRMLTDPEANYAEFTATAEQTIPIFEAADDQLGLARAWRIGSTRPWREGRVAEATEALTRSFEHARRAGDAREESESFQWMVLSHYAGPTTVEAARTLFDTFGERAERDRPGYAAMLHIQGAFEMIGGELERGRKLYGKGREIYHELGLRHHAAVAALIAADAEMQAGNAERAEELLLPGMETLLQLEDRAYTTETAALLSGALFAQGKVEEAAHFAAISEGAALSGDVFQMSAWRIVRSLVLVAEGEAGDAERHAREAVELLAGCDGPNSRAEAAMALAGVMMAQGKNEEVPVLVEGAEAAYGEKGNVLGTSRARELLAALA